MSDQGDTGARQASTIGPYLLHEEIGRGGMGVVYRATRADTGFEVAVKLMLPELSSNTRFRERFVAEAQTAPKLDHPNIVQVHDAGEVDRELYIAMQLIHGPDLKQVIDREGTIAPQRVITLLRQVSSALDYAHISGVVHRDIKPQNILLRADDSATSDVVYITDFGLVKPAGAESTASRTGEVFGSIQYMAPEQIEGMPTDGRADVYSLGCVAFEALTGSIPFDRSNEVAVLWAHVHEDPPRVSALRADLPGGLDVVVANAIAKHPDDRYLTCGEFTDALQEGLAKNKRTISMPIVRPLVERVPRKKTEREVWAPNFFPELSRVRRLSNKTNWPRVIGAAAIPLLLVSVLTQLAHPQGLTGAVQDVAQAAESVGESFFDTAFGDRRAGEDAAGGSSFPDEVDGIGSVTPTEARKSFRLLPEAPGPTAGGLTGRGKSASELPAGADSSEQLIAYVSTDRTDSEIWTVRPDGTGRRQLTNNTLEDRNPQWSPDGTQILFETFVMGTGGDLVNTYTGDLYVMDADGTGLTRLTNDPAWERDPAWSPDGKTIVFSEISNPDPDPEIKIISLEDAPGDERQIGLGSAPDWSPDGRWIAYSYEGLIWVRDPQGVVAIGNSSGAGHHEEPDWSPDGKRIAFVKRLRDTPSQLATFNPFSLGTSNSVTRNSSPPDWTPDNSIIYTRNGDLYALSPNGVTKTRLVDSPPEHPMYEAVWRPI